MLNIDPRLVSSTYPVCELALCHVLLSDDSRFPWLILVPKIAGAREFIDLDPTDQQTLLAEISHVARRLETHLRPYKLNIATLGNIVAQLHVHVIARYTDDAAWPQPVWGSGPPIGYSAEEAEARVAELRAALQPTD
ncbi:MAG: HIT family protein [Dokdonella sp.]